jgi:hypothetical protein
VSLLAAMLLFVIADPRINEASGIAARIVDPPGGVRAERRRRRAPVFALDADTRGAAGEPGSVPIGIVAAVLAVAGASAVWLRRVVSCRR